MPCDMHVVQLLLLILQIDLAKQIKYSYGKKENPVQSRLAGHVAELR